MALGDIRVITGRNSRGIESCKNEIDSISETPDMIQLFIVTNSMLTDPIDNTRARGWVAGGRSKKQVVQGMATELNNFQRILRRDRSMRDLGELEG